MDEAAVTQYITTFPGVDLVVASEDTYFFYNPSDDQLPPDHRFPFVTLVTGDRHDQVSDLNRPGVFRLNIGVSRETFRSLFAAPASEADDRRTETDYDFAALDQLLPHPVYAPQYWLCVLNPGPSTLDTVKTLLTEAYETAVQRRAKVRAAKTV